MGEGRDGNSEAAQIPREEEAVRKHRSGCRAHGGEPHSRLRPQQGQAPGDRPGPERHLLPIIRGKTSAVSGSPADSGGSLLQNVFPKTHPGCSQRWCACGQNSLSFTGRLAWFPRRRTTADPVRDYRDPTEVLQAG